MKNEDMPASPVLDPNGEPVKVVVIGQDDPDNKGVSFTNEMNCIGLTKLEAFTKDIVAALYSNPEIVSDIKNNFFWGRKESLIYAEQLARMSVEAAKATLAELGEE